MPIPYLRIFFLFRGDNIAVIFWIITQFRDATTLFLFFNAAAIIKNDKKVM